MNLELKRLMHTSGESQMYNDVFKQKYWDESGRNLDFFTILSQPEYREEKNFWNDIGVTEELSKVLSKDTVFLDFGCGLGRIARQVNEQVKEYHGVDFSDGMIEKAKEIHKDYSNVSFQQNNGKDLSILSDNKYDVVFSCLVMQHISKLAILNYFAELARVLKSGGYLFCYNIPKLGRYVNGLIRPEVEEFKDLFSKFNIVEDKFYFAIIAIK